MEVESAEVPQVAHGGAAFEVASDREPDCDGGGEGAIAPGQVEESGDGVDDGVGRICSRLPLIWAMALAELVMARCCRKGWCENPTLAGRRHVFASPTP